MGGIFSYREGRRKKVDFLRKFRVDLCGVCRHKKERIEKRTYINYLWHRISKSSIKIHFPNMKMWTWRFNGLPALVYMKSSVRNVRKIREKCLNRKVCVCDFFLTFFLSNETSSKDQKRERKWCGELQWEKFSVFFFRFPLSTISSFKFSLYFSSFRRNIEVFIRKTH